MKQLVPTSLDEYIAEHKEGDVVTGRVVEDSGEHARVELGEGIQATCRIVAEVPAKEETRPESKADLSSLSSMLQARWKGSAVSAAPSRTRFAPDRFAAFELPAWTGPRRRSNWNWRSSALNLFSKCGRI